MTQENNKQGTDASQGGKQDQPYDQGGHKGTGAHGGQQSGGMGGLHGGDLHDAGSAQSGMTGRAGMGGNDTSRSEGDDPAAIRQGGAEMQRDDSRMGNEQMAEVQQSAQREGMGQHRHSNRGNEQALDAAADVDSLGSHHSAAGKENPDQR